MSAPAAPRTGSPAMVSGNSTPKSTETNGFLLLTIQHAVIKQVTDEETMVLAKGEMRLECISLPIPADVGKQTANPFAPSPSDPAVPTHDFWLVLNVSTFEAPVIPSREWTPLPTSLEGISYSTPSQTIPNANVVITLPLPGSTAELEDLDSLEVLLRQYGCLGAEVSALTDIEAPHMGLGTHGAGPAPGDLRGRLVLINEDSGEVVGELDQRLSVVEDKMIAQGDKDKPVMLDFGGEVDGYSPQVIVKTVPEEEMDDWILKGAHLVSKGILGFGSWSSKTMQTGADSFIRNTKAAEKPVHFSPNTKAGIRMTHNASVKTVKVAKTTLGKINDALSVVAEKAYNKTVEPAVGFYQTSARKSISGESTTPPRRSSASGPVPLQAGAPPPYQASPLAGGTTASGAPASGKPPIPPKPANLSVDTSRYGADPKSAQASPYSQTASPNNVTASPNTVTPASASTSATAKKRPFLNRLLLAGEVVLTSLEATAQDLITNGTTAASSAAGHKFGPEAGHATALLGGSVRNVAVVYIDVRGVGRKALLTGTAKGFVKARLQNGQTVQLQAGGVEGPGGVEVAAGEAEQVPGEKNTVVVGMPQVGSQAGVAAVQGSQRQGGARQVSSVDQETLDMLERMK